VVYGCPAAPSGTWRDRIIWDTSALVQKPAAARDSRGLDAICDYRTIECLRGASLIEVTLHTGRRNQIRIQAHLHGHPLVGEERYTDRRGSAGRISFRRHALHARRLSFLHPSDERPLRFESPLPRDFNELLARLRKGGRVAPAASAG
jgi:23S rRNA pseudouridine1911/1915/1917 synthase